MGKLQSHFKRRTRGQAMVEFALVLPLMLIIVVNGLRFGEVYLRYSQVYQATAVGSRAVAIAGGDVAAAHTAITNQLAVLGITNVTYCNVGPCDPTVSNQATVIIPACCTTFGNQIVITTKYRYDLSLFGLASITPTKTYQVYVISESY